MTEETAVAVDNVVPFEIKDTDLTVDSTKTIIDCGITVDFPGLAKFIEDNEGSESDALKALWYQYRMEMEWKDYAVGANKSIVKLVMQLQRLVKAVRECTGVLTYGHYKDPDGKSLEFSEKFQELIMIGNLIKEKEMEDKLTERGIKKIRNNMDGTQVLVLDCGHEEPVDAETRKTTEFKIGQVICCRACLDLVEKMKQQS